MYCPQCGQQQVSEATRFCSRCGFLLEGVMELLALGGLIPARYAGSENRQLSGRKKGIRQGAMLMLSTLLVVPITAILAVSFLPIPEVIIPIVALVCFVGGLLRILYALLLEEPAESSTRPYTPPTGVPQLNSPHQKAGLPPASANPAGGWRRPNTAELARPTSVTENTTRLLDRDDPKTR